MNIPTQTPWQAAITDFNQAKSRGVLQKIVSQLTGQTIHLLSYDEVVARLKISGSSAKGIRQIPLDAIVGSVGRYTDFSRTFLPLHNADRYRWASVKSAAPHISDLPAIEVYQLGDYYFVLDGNHRVSIARQQGVAYIDAKVIEIRTRVPFAPDDNPTELIVKAEYANFLAYTGLDKLRPSVNLWVSVPDQYRHLENHIEVTRFFVEMEREQTLSWDEAVQNWYDHAYLPLVLAIREQGILRYFPERTETDLYVWLSVHLAALQHEFGWEIPPETAVPQLIDRIKERKSPSRGLRRILDVIKPDREQTFPPKKTWSQAKLLARYSNQLFTDILMLVPGELSVNPVWQQALVLVEREQSRLYGVSLLADPDTIAEQFQAACQQIGAEGFLSFSEPDDLLDNIQKRVVFTDLLLVSADSLPGDVLTQLIIAGKRPLLLAGSTPSPLVRPLLVYEPAGASQEALFVATYLAERWGSELTVLTMPDADGGPNADVYEYLALHEVTPVYLEKPDLAATTVLAAAVAYHCDVILVNNQSGSGNQTMTLETIQILQALCSIPLLIC